MSGCCRFMALLAATLAGTAVAAPTGLLHAMTTARVSETRGTPDAARLPTTVDGVIAALYTGVSGPADHRRDWSAFAGLFLPGARIGVTHPAGCEGVEIELMDVAAFGELNDRVFRGRGFFESEIHREQGGYGDVLHVWSVYEARRSPGDAPYARGANSLQMVRTPDGWRISSLTWDRERGGQRLAERFPVPDNGPQAMP